ncbi:sulfatase-like hydrolase/transferase [Vibrio hangzhouensis]|uniref:Arylsulfatase n=1 Tax=Vibrio hangzhouensis TaxID=462991 RepID=A0A1H5TLQ2_9VIBR|nr:sulfatase-like hydrolase/transferase [Vibrio hangzhouensis]SEF63710.1 arylsulfatase [Vibrio hangzhouensis]
MKLKNVTAALLIASIGTASAAPVFDTPFYKTQERNQEQWQVEDKDIDAKLAELEKKHGKKPNIIYILTDDIGWGELGWQGGGKHRGTPTPALDQMASEGMAMWSAYAEPSCTPTRIALNTGRLPVRTGLIDVLWPGQENGLPTEEVGIAELLGEAGYDTAMWGKWHMGEEAEHSPVAHGYDYAYYGLFNGAPDGWQSSHDTYNQPTNVKAPFMDFPGNEEYLAQYGIDLSVSGYTEAKGEERQPILGKAGELGPDRQAAFEKESSKQMIQYVKDQAQDEDPFFIYWASYALQITGSAEHQDAEGVDKANAQASMMVQHNEHVQSLLDTLRDEGIAENTLVVWISDNGPMYAFYPTSGYSLLKGGKGDVTEGGVRVPAMAWWPGMIEAGQQPTDMFHVTDLYTTAARLAGATDKIPTDRVIDGLDQTSLLLNGEGHGRRDYMFHYKGSELGAIRMGDYKIHIEPSSGGLPHMDFYNIKRDPGEKFGGMYNGLYMVKPIQDFIGGHKGKMEEYPNRDTSETLPSNH